MALFKKFSFFEKLFSYTMIILLLFSLNTIKCDNIESIYNKTFGETCSSNLECNSACCSSDKCDETSKCEKLVTTVYIAEAALCLAFIIAFTIYLVIKLKKVKEDFRKKTSPEDSQNNPKQN